MENLINVSLNNHWGIILGLIIILGFLRFSLKKNSKKTPRRWCSTLDAEKDKTSSSQ